MSTVRCWLLKSWSPSKADKRLSINLLCNEIVSNDYETMEAQRSEDEGVILLKKKIGKVKIGNILKNWWENVSLTFSPTVHSTFASTSESNNKGLRTSDNISLLIANSGKPHTIGYQLNWNQLLKKFQNCSAQISNGHTQINFFE